MVDNIDPFSPSLMERIEGAIKAGTTGDTYPLIVTNPNHVDAFWCLVEASNQQPAFHISRYPVTVALFRDFVRANGYQSNDFWTPQGSKWRNEKGVREPLDWLDTRDQLRYPVVGVSWYEAVAFCRWLSQRLGQPIRLPTTLEWARAACGPKAEAFPWGTAEYRCGYANVDEHRSCSGSTMNPKVGLCPVGLFPWARSRSSGAEDMVGNILEWCLTDRPKFEPDAILLENRARAPRLNCWHEQIPGKFLTEGALDKDVRLAYLGFRIVMSG